MAGSTILAAKQRRASLSTVALTVNNHCNLACPHCYLQYAPDGEDCRLISDRVARHVLEADFEHLAIVGKEPFVDRASTEVVRRLTQAAHSAGRTVSAITNGLNLDLVDDATLALFSWLDVSMDGGASSYASYRGGSWAKLRNRCLNLHGRGLRELRVLNTLSLQTVAHVDDMVVSARELGASKICFSPFQPTSSNGVQTDGVVGLTEMLAQMAPFSADADIHLILDLGYLSQLGPRCPNDALSELAGRFGDRFHLVNSDPIDRGIIRVTYDGWVMTPLESVHTGGSAYHRIARPVLGKRLSDWFAVLLEEAARRPTVAH